MSDSHIISEKENELSSLEDADFSDKSKELEELSVKLQELRDENKKRMDSILQSLDELKITKSFLTETLDQTETTDAVLTEVINKNSKVADILAEIVGCSEKINNFNFNKTAIEHILEDEPLNSINKDSTEMEIEKNGYDLSKVENAIENNSDDNQNDSSEVKIKKDGCDQPKIKNVAENNSVDNEIENKLKKNINDSKNIENSD